MLPVLMTSENQAT